jgi:hypothetical protein
LTFVTRAAGMLRIGLVVIGLGSSVVARAQTPTVDSIAARVARLVARGQQPAARLLLDSVLAATPPRVALFPEILFQRARLAARATDAEEDYRRIAIEYPLSPREADALLELATIEHGRGDRDLAILHLRRFLDENASLDGAKRCWSSRSCCSSKHGRPRHARICSQRKLPCPKRPPNCAISSSSKRGDALVSTRRRINERLKQQQPSPRPLFRA